ncbi:MAG TPA: hypothetical protein PK156_50440 [Polyangium sp.]|nr:hypothetical protein [Polyangium sp.]
MSFHPNLPEAATRHLQAADLLCIAPGHRRDVAGYLYGIAAECAIKQMLVPLKIEDKYDKDAMYYAHFPELRTLLRDALERRRRTSDPLFRFVFNDSFMNNWHISMRYADARQVRGEWLTAWQTQAKDAVGAMEAHL